MKEKKRKKKEETKKDHVATGTSFCKWENTTTAPTSQA